VQEKRRRREIKVSVAGAAIHLMPNERQNYQY